MHAVRSSAATLLACLLAVFAATVPATAQTYTSIVVFGDSLSDTGNVAALTRAKYTVNFQVPGPNTGYTDGRFTDGLDTAPAARNFTGIWVEQLAARLPNHPTIKASLAGGTDYAYGDATTANGTTTAGYGTGSLLSITVNNMGQQVADYLSTNPTITANTLFVLWGGANDLLNATSAADVTAAADREAALAQLLINAGATQILINTLPPLGLIPRLNGAPATSTPATAASQAFDSQLGNDIVLLLQSNAAKNIQLRVLDTYTLFSTIAATPSTYGFSNVTASSQFNVAVNPDTYLFWDDLHPTTAGHSLIAAAALATLGPAVTTSTSLTSSSQSSNLSAAVTFTATVTVPTGTPTGTVLFSDGTTTLGSAIATGTTTSATATFTTSTLASGVHTITATFLGVNGSSNSTSPTLTQTVVAPALVLSPSPSTLTIARGSSGSTTLTLGSVGGYAGTLAVTCGTLPSPDFTCTVATPSITLASGATATTAVTLNTKLAASLRRPAFPHHAPNAPILAALLGLPFLARLAFTRRRPSLLLLVLLSSAALGLTGCAGDSNANSVPTGTYTINITVTPAGGSILPAVIPLTVTVQ